MDTHNYYSILSHYFHKSFLLVMLLSVSSFQLSAQCDGNLGENIFTEGDFGSGALNIPLTDPQIAPGYTYTTNPPPNDGLYTITNDLTVWATAFSWLRITDNSNDPNGYMMVVNASHTPGLFYEQTVDGLCENTTYVFSADIYNLIRTGSNKIKPNVSFLIDGVVVYGSGDIPENEIWNTYGFTFTTQPGQNSVTLALQNNAPGGIGNDLALDNMTFRPCGPEALILPEEIANICEDGTPIQLEATINGDQYDTPHVQWQQSFDEGLSWVNITGENDTVFTHTNLAAGFYYYRYLLANAQANLANPKCRVVSNTKIVRVVPKFYTLVDTLCTGLAFTLGNKQYTNSGTYVDSLKTTLGCDSIVTLHLTILPDPGITATYQTFDPTCDYLSDGSIIFGDAFNGTPPYTLYIDGVPSVRGSMFDLPVGSYRYEIVDYFGCKFDEYLTLLAPPAFTVEIGEDQTLELGEFLELSPMASAPVADLVWKSNGEIICDSICDPLSWAPPRSGFVSVTATSDKGCEAADSIYVELEIKRKLYAPTAFTPNGDGTNDYFTLYGPQPMIQQIDELLIFNQWGNLVFQKNDFMPSHASIGWDGRSAGKVLPEGVYLYMAKVRFLDGEVLIQQGSISLLR